MKKHGSLFQSLKRLYNKLLNEKCKFSPKMIIFAKQLRERPTECMSDALFVTLRHTHCPTTERILDQILTYMIAVLENIKCITKVKKQKC